MLVCFLPRVWGKRPCLPKINNFICCSINVQYKFYFFQQLYILGAANSTFFLRWAFSPVVPHSLYLLWFILIYLRKLIVFSMPPADVPNRS